MRKALVTGGSGFIGNRLVNELLKHGYAVTIYDLMKPIAQGVEFVQGNIIETDLVSRTMRGKDVVFHLAGVLGTDYLCERVIKAVDINIKGSIEVFEAARVNGTKVINTGLIPEWDNPYMIAKKAVMRFSRMYCREFKMRITTVEVSHVYGPGQPTRPYRKAIPNFIVRALQGKDLEIFGLGDKSMDCIYVDDVAKALRLAAETDRTCGKVLQLGSGEGIMVAELAERIIKLTNSKSCLRYVPMRRGEPEESDDFKAVRLDQWLELVGWKPSMTLAQGLDTTIEWYRAHLPKEEA